MKKIIAHITDTHIDDPTATSHGDDPRKNLLAVLEDAVAQEADDLVFTGDIGEDSSYGWLFERLREFKSGFRFIPGNHDALNEAEEYYRNTVSAGPGGLYYTEEDDTFTYVYIDSSAAEIKEMQFEWLEGAIKSHKHIIIFIHHPILGFKTGMDKMYPLKNRERIVKLLNERNNSVIVFCGHYHMTDYRTSGNISQYITPAVSFQVKKESNEIDIYTGPFGYRLITLDPDKGTIETRIRINRGGTFITEEDMPGAG